MICNLMEFVTYRVPCVFFLIKIANSDGAALIEMYRTVRIKMIRFCMMGDGLILYVS